MILSGNMDVTYQVLPRKEGGREGIRVDLQPPRYLTFQIAADVVQQKKIRATVVFNRVPPARVEIQLSSPDQLHDMLAQLRHAGVRPKRGKMGEGI